MEVEVTLDTELREDLIWAFQDLAKEMGYGMESRKIGADMAYLAERTLIRFVLKRTDDGTLEPKDSVPGWARAVFK